VAALDDLKVVHGREMQWLAHNYQSFYESLLNETRSAQYQERQEMLLKFQRLVSTASIRSALPRRSYVISIPHTALTCDRSLTQRDVWEEKMQGCQVLVGTNGTAQGKDSFHFLSQSVVFFFHAQVLRKVSNNLRTDYASLLSNSHPAPLLEAFAHRGCRS
jgi:hypothetical protein